MGVNRIKSIIVLILISLILIQFFSNVGSIEENGTLQKNSQISTFSNSRDNVRSNEIEVHYGGDIYSHPEIAVNKQNIYLVWHMHNGLYSMDIWDSTYFSRSTDGGFTWENDYNFGKTTEESHNNPDIAINGSNIHAIWGEYPGYPDEECMGLCYKASYNNGTNWENKSYLEDLAGEPSIGLNHSTIYIIRALYHDLFFKKSIDNGKTWGNDIKLTHTSSINDTGSLEIPIAVFKDNIHILWSDDRNGNLEIYYKKSLDCGNTWIDDLRLTNNDNRSIRPSIAVDGNNIHIVWMDDRDGNHEIYYKKSIDNGNSWGNNVRLTNNSSLSHNPVIETNGNKIHVIWSDDRNKIIFPEIFYKFSNDGGKNWSIDYNLNLLGEHPAIAIEDNYIYLVYDRGGDYSSGIYFSYYPFLPKIVVYPSNNSNNISILTDISLMFNQPMNHASVQNAFSISSNISGTFYWDDINNTCNFVPTTQLLPNTQYIVKLTGTASNSTGATLDGNGNGILEGSPIDDYIWSFKTVNIDLTPPKIVNITPENNSQNISLTTSIQVTFSEPMNTTATQNAFTIVPFYTEGSFNWSNNNHNLTFTPTFNFNRNTTYKVIISTDAKDLANNSLDGNKNGISEISSIDDYIWTISTERYIPVTELIYPANHAVITTPTPILEWDLENVYVWPENTPIVYFDIYLNTNLNKVMNLDSTARIVKNLTAGIYQVITPINDIYYWTVIPQTINTPTTGWTIDTIGYCKSGIWQFRPDLPPGDLIPPQIISTFPYNNSIDVNADISIQVVFNEPMNTTSVELAFSISPNITGEFNWTDNNTIMKFIPQSYLELSQNYTCTISALARDFAGNLLDGNMNLLADGSSADDYYWSFTTASILNLAPLIKIDSPLNNSVFNVNDTIYFDCSNTTDFEGDTLEFLWVSNISGILSTEPKFVIYLPIGHHQVTLFVNDGRGHNISTAVNIIVTPFNRPPIAIIDSPKNNDRFNTTDLIYFNASSSKDMDGDILNFYWHSNVSGGLGFTSKFSSRLPAGHHLITLFVIDGFYHNVSVGINITILDGTTGPANGGSLKPPPTETDTNVLSQIGFFGAIVIIIFIVIIAGFVTATEIGKFGFFGFFNPLYTRLKGKKVLDHETRGMIRGYILANPGDHYSNIKRTLGLKNGVLTYHLKVLEREELIKSRRDGIYKRFFPIEERVPENITHLTKIQESILNEIVDKPGITERGLGKKLEVSHRVINYHIKKLISANLIKAERFGKKTKYYVLEELEST